MDEGQEGLQALPLTLGGFEAEKQPNNRWHKLELPLSCSRLNVPLAPAAAKVKKQGLDEATFDPCTFWPEPLKGYDTESSP